MGCDIEACIEYRHRKGSAWADGRWYSWGTGVMHLMRDYRLFAALSGERKSIGFEELIPARGIPDDLGSVAFNQHHTLILEGAGDEPRCLYNHVRRLQLRPHEVVVKRGAAEYLRGQESSACHGFSYLTLEEIQRCLAHAGLELEKTELDFQATVAAMGKLAEVYETRLVFWYDF